MLPGYDNDKFSNKSNKVRCQICYGQIFCKKKFYQSEKIKRVTRLIKSLAFHNSVQDHHYMPVSKVVDPLA